MSAQNAPQDDGQSSHMMKNSRRGRPFLKDTFDLFATLIVSLQLSTHKQFFRSFPNSFTTDEAATNLASLKFSQSMRGPDPRNPNRIITTTTTTTFSMTRDMAKHIAQHFMDARLIENAADKANTNFKDRAIFQITPKGLHVLERFIAKNGITADGLVQVFATQPICMKLLHLERRQSDDDIITTEHVILTVFRRFAGRAPNYIVNTAESPLDATQEYYERANGVPLQDIQERQQQMIGRGTLQTYRNTFTALTALEWLCDFTTIVGRDEAAEMCAHFMRYRLIELVSDKRRTSDEAVIFTVRGPAGPNSLVEASFRCTPKAVYQITDEGKRVARWSQNIINGAPMPDGQQDPIIAKKEAAARIAEASRKSSESGGAEAAFGPGAPPMPATITSMTDAKIQRRASVAERLRGDYQKADLNAAANDRKSNTDRLKSILDEPALRHLFREFLRGNFCEENLSFWLDVQDFKRRFHTTSSAIANNASANASYAAARPSATPKLNANGTVQTPGQAAMEKHHEALVGMTFVIYNTYLAQGSACELNIDHALRNELYAYLNEVIIVHQGGSQSSNVSRPVLKGRVEPEQANAFNATQLQAIIRIYERIQIHVFRLMATDSVPKFIKTQRFLALRSWVDDVDAMDNEEMTYGPSTTPASPPGLPAPAPNQPVQAASSADDEVGRAYLTVSQAANEKRQTKLKSKLAAAAANASETSLSSR